MRRLWRSKGGDPERVLLEGPHLIEAAQRAGTPLLSLLAAPEAASRNRQLLDRLALPVTLVRGDLLDETADAHSPRGLLAIARRPATGLACLPALPRRPYLYLEGIQDPGNLGALARVAEAAGAAGICLGAGTAQPFHPRALRASAGSLLRLPLAHATPQELERHLAAAGAEWTALVPEDGEDLYQAELPATPILALGAEGPGLSAALAARCRHRVRVPMAPQVESLNVAVAAAVVLFELRRRAL